MKQQIIIILSCLIVSSQVFSRDDTCPTIPSYYDSEHCNCGEQLNNLEVTLPKGLKVLSSCLYDYSRPVPERRIDLSKETVSLNEYKNGEIPEGTLYLTANLIISGEIYYEPGQSGDYWFLPRWNFRERTPINDLLGDFKFLDDDLPLNIKIEKSMVDSECLKASARIKINGLRILIGQSDEAGTYPFKTKILSIGKYKPCK
jgi:hypothetical protein